ncbi:MAG: DUF4333 domain-containing protein [Candidatus Nanopelagicales bacterium]
MRKTIALALSVPMIAAPMLVAGPAQAESVVKIPKVKKSIKSGFKSQAGKSVKVKCPKKVRWAKGKIFYCKAKGRDGSKYRVMVKLGSESTGRVTWKVVS